MPNDYVAPCECGCVDVETHYRTERTFVVMVVCARCGRIGPSIPVDPLTPRATLRRFALNAWNQRAPK